MICNAILNIGLFLVMTIDIGNQNLREILFGILRLLIGISANVYATAVVIGNQYLNYLENAEFLLIYKLLRLSVQKKE